MASAGYRIADEPQPSGVAHLAVRPVWPLFAMMFVGPWFSWPWFVLNGFAVGSPTRIRELAMTVVGFLGSFGLLLGIEALWNTGVLDKSILPYAFVLLTAWKLGVSLWLYMLQSRTFELYEYYGGVVKNGLFLVILATFLEPRLWSSVTLSATLMRVLN